MSDVAIRRCGICGRLLDDASDPLSDDCGGDCWGCIGEIEADYGEPTSLARVRAEHAAGLRPSWIPRPSFVIERDPDKGPVSLLAKVCFTRPSGEPYEGLGVTCRLKSIEFVDGDGVTWSEEKLVTNDEGVAAMTLDIPRGAKRKKLHIQASHAGITWSENMMTAIETTRSRSESDREGVAPRAAALLPLAYLLHLAEEWFGDFSAWTLSALGREIGPDRFVLINATAFVLFTVGTLAALRVPRMAFFAASLAALLGLNGLLHALATVGLGRYSPGTVTGLLLYVPLSFIVLRASAARLSRPVFAGAVIFGVILHGIIALLAFR